MKNLSYIFIISFLHYFIISCSPQKAETQDTAQTEQTDEGIRCLSDYAYTDSLMQGSHKVVYTITGQADDELSVVTDEDGTQYKDNRWQLVITKDGRTLFNRSFSKADFKSQLPDDFKKYGIMDGLRFHHAEEGKLYFNTCVSFPDSDMSCPFVLTIGPDGSYTISPDTSFDEDGLPPTPDKPKE